MITIQNISEKKQKQLDEFNKTPFQVGEHVNVRYDALNNFNPRNQEYENCKIVEVLKSKIKVKYSEGSYKSHDTVFSVKPSDIVGRRNTLNVGVNPFDADDSRTRSINYDLSSILYTLGVCGDNSRNEKYKINGIKVDLLNTNPFVYVDGEKKYYQRDYCWTLQDKQNLIQSLYLGIEIGKILVRKRSWEQLERLSKNGETVLAFNDIVDGKQRLDALRGFLMNEYPDADGNYYGDLSFMAQNKFSNNNLLSYAEMDEDCTDAQVLKQFLKMNFSGVPQSKEHLDYVKSLIK